MAPPYEVMPAAVQLAANRPVQSSERAGVGERRGRGLPGPKVEGQRHRGLDLTVHRFVGGAALEARQDVVQP
ncbi:MAG TPA: hypothetical protein VEG62_08000, partial [Acidimicrobiales bacterium]|nr:hypothetical protein [Acidimicrobiales bacterium]